eukprot:754220-Hanusia_phi.AAC.1
MEVTVAVLEVGGRWGTQGGVLPSRFLCLPVLPRTPQSPRSTLPPLLLEATEALSLYCSS